MSLKSEKTTISLSITYNEVKHNAKKTVDIYVLNETAKNSVSNEGLIDIKKPVYKSQPSNTITNTNSILLSKKEIEFVNSK